MNQNLVVYIYTSRSFFLTLLNLFKMTYKIQSKSDLTVIKECSNLEDCKRWFELYCNNPHTWQVEDPFGNILPGNQYHTWRCLEYGDEINYSFPKPEASFLGIKMYSADAPIVNVKCTINIDHQFPDNKEEIERGLSKNTFKVTITPVEEDDQMIYGRERTYFSDIQNKILEHNPGMYIKPYQF
ncbi:MAG: hypothetical protein RLY43_2498 [Bacteroidota bacterium]